MVRNPFRKERIESGIHETRNLVKELGLDPKEVFGEEIYAYIEPSSNPFAPSNRIGELGLYFQNAKVEIYPIKDYRSFGLEVSGTLVESPKQQKRLKNFKTSFHYKTTINKK